MRIEPVWLLTFVLISAVAFVFAVTTFWLVVRERGDKGEPGDRGPMGYMGQTGPRGFAPSHEDVEKIVHEVVGAIKTDDQLAAWIERRYGLLSKLPSAGPRPPVADMRRVMDAMDRESNKPTDEAAHHVGGINTPCPWCNTTTAHTHTLDVTSLPDGAYDCKVRAEPDDLAFPPGASS